MYVGPEGLTVVRNPSDNKKRKINNTKISALAKQQLYDCLRTNLLKTNVRKYPSPLQVLKRIYPDEAASEDPYKLNISHVKHIINGGLCRKNSPSI